MSFMKKKRLPTSPEQVPHDVEKFSMSNFFLPISQLAGGFNPLEKH